MSWVHDNEIISYEVNLKNDKIVVHTFYEKDNQTEFTDIIFEGVISHLFEHPLKGSIILDIQDYNIQLFLKENKELLAKNKNHGWPLMYNDIEELERKLSQEHFKYIVIYSSYGLNGWVLAKDYKIDVKANK